MDRSLPFEFRWLGDNSVTEGYAMLFDHRLTDRGWLARYTALGTADLPAYLRATGFEELQFLRRYCAKLIYEVELHAGTTPWHALPDLYVKVDDLKVLGSWRCLSNLKLSPQSLV